MPWLIYKHTNKINGKVYIGQTKRNNPESRWGKNGYRYKGQAKFWNAIKKYGWNNFDHDILEKNISSQKIANEKEMYWINFYNSLDSKFGYNQVCTPFELDSKTKYNVNIGNKFGKWTVISEPYYIGKYPGVVVKCKCECGKEREVRIHALVRGKSLGCQDCRRIRCNPIGQKFGKLTILEEVEPSMIGKSKKPVRRFKCRCDCGKEITTTLPRLKDGQTRSCGCLRKESSSRIELYNRLKKIKLKYPGGYRTKLCSVWQTMKRKCYEKTNENYKNYGQKGIRVCQEWLDNYMSFYNWSYANGYKEEVLPNGYNKFVLDRLDSNKDFCPDNCRWIEFRSKSRKKVKCIETGIIYNCAHDAMNATTIKDNSICCCCLGKRKTAGGYHWEYVNND